MSVPEPRSRPPKPLAAGVFQPEIGSFRLCLAAGGKPGKTVRGCTGAVRWFAAAHLIPQNCPARGGQVSGEDIQRWMVWLLGRYSDSCASSTNTAPCGSSSSGGPVRKVSPDPMARLRPPRVSEKLIPVFTSAELPKPGQVCAGRTFAQRRGLAIVAVFGATGVRLSELAGIVYDAEDAQRSDVDLWRREKRSGARAVRRGSSGSATKPPSASTATSGSGHGMPRRTGRSYGWE